MTERSAIFEGFAAKFETAIKLKRRMQSKKLRRARAVCPHCDGGMISAVLAGPKDHIHARCSTPSCFQVME